MTDYEHTHAEETLHGPGVICAVLMPHAPILVPGVGGERGDAAADSRQAMRRAAACVTRHRPETVVLISPHSPRQPPAFGLWMDDPLQGSFARFEAPQVEVSLPLDEALAEAIAAAAATRGLETRTIRHHALDHGALVPLWFLMEAGWKGSTVVVGLETSDRDGLIALGQTIAAAAHKLTRRIAVIASGDLSHRLTTGAPCGFHPQAHQFDDAFIHLLQAGDYRRLGEIPAELRALAAEDAVDATLLAASAAHWENSGHGVLNYEAPFGVGYGVAVLWAEPSPPKAEMMPASEADCEGRGLPALARRSVVAALDGRPEPPPAPPGPHPATRHGVFVTIRETDGALRGCVGTIDPACPDVPAETWRSARLAALQDGRFTPVTTGELAGLRFEVSVLHPAEAVASAASLDPRRYGVIVSTRDGRRGLLLPGINDIKTTEQQLLIARRKGGIAPDEPVTLQRFQVDHFTEAD
jgi:AmmeMemoRadiSam system protein A/AmmeMemoRadiSam system protein B